MFYFITIINCWSCFLSHIEMYIVIIWDCSWKNGFMQRNRVYVLFLFLVKCKINKKTHFSRIFNLSTFFFTVSYFVVGMIFSIVVLLFSTLCFVIVIVLQQQLGLAEFLLILSTVSFLCFFFISKFFYENQF